MAQALPASPTDWNLVCLGITFADVPPPPVPWLGDWVVSAWVWGLLLVGFVLLACYQWPGLWARPLLWLVTHSIYRLRVTGVENIPATGGALLVCNHVTYLDWFWLLASQKRWIRFVIYAPFARVWGLRHLMEWGGAIPIDGSAGPRAVLTALREASKALQNGELVGIFAEGALTRTGMLMPFHRGFEQILKKAPVPIIPVCLDQAWGSIFSYRGGKVLTKWPQEVPYPVSIAFGPPLPPSTTAAEVRLVIQKLSADCAHARVRRPVHRQFIRTAARHPFRPCFLDPSARDPVLNYAKAATGAICLARLLRPILGEEAKVAIWLPSSVGGALANVALAMLGKTSVNLNYTAGQAALEYAMRACGIRHVLTARRFTAKLKLEPPAGVELVYLEDLIPKVTAWQKTMTYLSVVLLPGWFLDRWVLGLGNHGVDQLATIIFSSGSTGEPKGIMLTQGNIAANAESMVQAISLQPADRILGVLPFFHSFGYTVTLWAPLQVGASVVYYPDPRQAKEIGELCRSQRCTIFLTTPTFLRFCLRRCERGDFDSLRILMCGAEKLPQSLADDFEAKLGVRPLEGYGCTELSPAVAANVPDQTAGGITQVCSKAGTVGQPLPGIAARVVEAETLKPLPPGEEGLLLIYGPNVMKGYLHKEELTRKVIRDGWYVTGDMARINEDGFITITGRLSRFAKVGGEMVPLEKIEEELHGILQTSDKVCAVTAVPDERRGERVVVLHLPLGGTNVHDLTQKLGHRGLPNLWIPGEHDFYQVADMPLLGSGKLDLKRLNDMALDRVRTNGH